MKLRFGLAVLALPLFSSCSMENSPKYSVVQNLRVLALTLSEPEVGFDGTTFTTTGPLTLTPTISDLYGGGRSLSYRVTHCMDPGVGIGATPTCAGNPTLITAATGTILDGDTPQYHTPDFTGSTTPIPINLGAITGATLAPYAAKFASLSSAQRFNGYAILVFFELFPTGDESSKVTTFKRLIFSSKGTRNQNPSGLIFRVNSLPISTLPTTEVSVEAFLTGVKEETYSLANADGSFSNTAEIIETAWFLTGPEDVPCSKKKECTPDGLFILSRTLPNELNPFYPPQVAIPTSRDRVLIGVAKDNRGGVTVGRLCDGPTCP